MKHKKDWQYKAIMWINMFEVFLILGIIYFAANYSWWLLLLFIFLGDSNTERRILSLPEKD